MKFADNPRDHRDNIFDYAELLESDLCKYVEDRDDFEYFLDIEVFRSLSDPERYRAEFLLGCGGPTIRVYVDQYDCVTLLHSWGMDHEGNDRTELELHGKLRQRFLDLAEFVASSYE